MSYTIPSASWRGGIHAFLGLCLLMISVMPSLEAAGGDIQVTWKEDRLSVLIVDADLLQVLQKISETCQLKFNVNGPLSRRLSIAFQDLPLEAGLAKILADTNYSLVYGTKNASEEKSEIALQEVIVLGKSTAALEHFGPEPTASRKRGLTIPGGPDPATTAVLPDSESTDPKGSGDQDEVSQGASEIPGKELEVISRDVSEVLRILKEAGWEHNKDFKKALEKLSKERHGGVTKEAIPE